VNPNPTSANREQIEYWNGPRGATWVVEQEMRDRALAPFSDATLDAAQVVAGERAIDVGCGCGANSLELGRLVGPRGAVLGIDISEPMLARARERATGLAQVRFERADASVYPFAGDAALLFSRFGVMFFEDPFAAFQNLRKALAPGGRIAFACWRRLDENEWMALPFGAVKKALSLPSPQVPPDAPGPLAFADPNRIRRILDGAGFHDAVLTPFDHAMPLGDGHGLDAAAADAASMGPAGRLLADLGEVDRNRAVAAIREALVPHASGDDVRVKAGIWIVRAGVPG
jgi:SAM-dependent methyltransferase